MPSSAVAARFADRLLRAPDVAESTSIDDGGRAAPSAGAVLNSVEQVRLAGLVQESVLATMASGATADALDWFPRLLQFLEVYPDVAADFKQRTQGLPSWVLLKWLGQVRASSLGVGALRARTWA